MAQENVPFRGPALLVSNHMSHVDGFLIGACVQRFIRFMVWKPYYEMKAFHWFFRRSHAIPVGTGGPRDMVESIRAARSELAAGHVVCIFAEGAISRTGNMLPFKRGMEKIVDGRMCPSSRCISTGCGAASSASRGGKFFWKWPITGSVPRDRQFRRAAAIQQQRADGPPGDSGTFGAKPPPSAKPPAICWTAG